MQIVIDIDDGIAQGIIEGNMDEQRNIVRNFRTTIACAIKYGTPLPKGHGRIADMDAAIECIEDVNGDDAIWAISLIEWACRKRTIIEADKESKV